MNDVSKRTRCADQGNGTYINPILFGNYSDPSILRDGDDYYMVADYDCMFHSKDLVNWEHLYTMTPKFREFGVMPWAPDIAKHGDTFYYYSYTPTSRCGKDVLMVMATKDIHTGDWGDIHVMGSAGTTLEGDELIDPAHVVGKDGKRYLCMSKNYLYPLSDDGLKVTGPAVQICDDWPIPDSWDIEGVYTEGPKFAYRNGWYYLMVAEGGTIGPPTSHGAVAFRARDVMGPWESSPYNPIVHTNSVDETWWSRGHASFIDTPSGEWYILYHAILNGYREQGRMLVMEPIEWTDDDWFCVPEGVMPDDPLPMPTRGRKVLHGFPLKDTFSTGKLESGWMAPRTSDQAYELEYISVEDRVSFCNDGLIFTAKGTSLHDTEPLIFCAGFKAFEIVTELQLQNVGAGGGISMYYGPQYFCGISLQNGIIRAYDGMKPLLAKPFNLREYMGDSIFFKLVYRDQVVSPWYSSDGKTWAKLNICTDVSLYCIHANINGIVQVRPALFAFGEGSVIFKQFEIIPLDTGI